MSTSIGPEAGSGDLGDVVTAEDPEAVVGPGILGRAAVTGPPASAQGSGPSGVPVPPVVPTARVAGGGRGGGRRPGPARTPSLRVERTLAREGHVLVAGMDEVGRGALAGPVSVGVVVVTATTRSAPSGVRDSKLLTPSIRERLAPRVRRWAHGHGVGHASPEEIDTFGILAALRLAGLRALGACGLVPDVVILDGKHDWLTGRAAEEALFDLGPPPPWPDVPVPPVRTRIKADMACSSVAAASILAKVERDARMVELAGVHPHYGWAVNKGYAAPEHRAALLEHGPCELHRRSWRLMGEAPVAPRDPGRSEEADGAEFEVRADVGDDGPVKGKVS